MNKYLCALLDIDGTLVDSNEFHVAAWYEAIRECGFNASKELIHDQIGKGADNLLPDLFPSSEEWQRKDMEERHGRIFKEKYLGQVNAFPDAANLVRWFHENGVKAVLASSAGRADIDAYISLLQIGDALEASVSGDDVTHSKPDGDIFAAALAKTQLRADEALAIGDSPYDIIAARSCGIGAIALLSGGFQAKVLEEAGSLAIYEDAADLLHNIEASPFCISAS